MIFYIIETDKRYIAPSPIGWNGKLDAQTLNNAESIKLPNHTVFFVENNMQMVFTDIITFPCFMVSKEVKDVILLYDPFIRFERVIFFSREQKRSVAYYFPILEKVNCLLPEESILNHDKSVVIHAKIEKEKLNGKAIVRIDGLKCTCVLISMDLANSILRRSVVGIGLRETEGV